MTRSTALKKVGEWLNSRSLTWDYLDKVFEGNFKELVDELEIDGQLRILVNLVAVAVLIDRQCQRSHVRMADSRFRGVRR